VPTFPDATQECKRASSVGRAARCEHASVCLRYRPRVFFMPAVGVAQPYACLSSHHRHTQHCPTLQMQPRISQCCECCNPSKTASCSVATCAASSSSTTPQLNPSTQAWQQAPTSEHEGHVEQGVHRVGGGGGQALRRRDVVHQAPHRIHLPIVLVSLQLTVGVEGRRRCSA
jgi:hypothetical protein